MKARRSKSAPIWHHNIEVGGGPDVPFILSKIVASRRNFRWNITNTGMGNGKRDRETGNGSLRTTVPRQHAGEFKMVDKGKEKGTINLGKREEPGTVTVVNWCQVFWQKLMLSEARPRPQLVSTSLLAMLLTLLTGMTPIFYMGIGNLKKYHTMNIGYSEAQNDTTYRIF